MYWHCILFYAIFSTVLFTIRFYRVLDKRLHNFCFIDVRTLWPWNKTYRPFFSANNFPCPIATGIFSISYAQTNEETIDLQKLDFVFLYLLPLFSLFYQCYLVVSLWMNFMSPLKINNVPFRKNTYILKQFYVITKQRESKKAPSRKGATTNNINGFLLFLRFSPIELIYSLSFYFVCILFSFCLQLFSFKQI